MEFSELIKERYSCKSFSGRVPSREQINEILEAGRLAPTAKNLQKQHIYVIESDENLAKIDECTVCRYGAPVVLLVAYIYDEESYHYPGGNYDSGAEDMAIIATHMMLAATNAGVDNCWLNRFDPDKLKSLLSLPENEHIVMLLDLGFANDGVTPLLPHYKRKDLDKTVSYI